MQFRFDAGIQSAAEGTMHQHLGTLADIGGDGRFGQGRPAQVCEHQIDCSREIGSGVE